MYEFTFRPVVIPRTKALVLPRPMDDFFTCDISFFASVEKATINGPAGVFDMSQKLPTHAGKVVCDHGRLMLAEMTEDKNDHGKMVLVLNRFSKYEENGFFGDRFVAFKRTPFYDDDARRNKANERLMMRWADGQTKYDKPGLFSFFFKKYLPFIKVKQDTTKFYCSELNEDELNKDGLTYTDFPLERRGLISPFDLFNAKTVHEHTGNSYAYFFL